MRRICAYMLIIALPLFFSCGKASRQDASAPMRTSSLWQVVQWDKCSKLLRKCLDSSVRAHEMRTLDAAFAAILASSEPLDQSCVIPFTCEGASCEARIHRNGEKATVIILREGNETGILSMDDNSFSGESAGISFTASNTCPDDTEIHAGFSLSSDGTTLSTLKADGSPELIALTLELPAGIVLSGEVEGRRLWDILRGIADDGSEDKVTSLAGEADAAVRIGIYYETDPDSPHARLSIRPFHLVSRYDDYWTWEFIVLTEDGDVLNEARNPLGDIFSGTAAFVRTWRGLMPHILS